MQTNKLDDNYDTLFEEWMAGRIDWAQLCDKIEEAFQKEILMVSAEYNPNLSDDDSEYKTDLDIRYDEYLEMVKEYSDGNIEY